MARGVAEAGLLHVDLHVLSDTQDPAIASAEQAAYAAALARAPQGVGLSYRRRPSNAGRKVGNLAEFCDRRGAEYDYMIVLDADSLMSAGALGRLIGLMDANPRTGIIQTVPYPVGRETLFARLQQFAARLYTPLLVEGLTWWQQADGNYWGHNAIIRIAPFRAHCAMPVLPGREPWGRGDPLPRRGGGRADARCRVGRLGAARGARELRGGAGEHGRFRRAGAAVVPGQPAAQGPAAAQGGCGRSGGSTLPMA